MTTEKTIVTVPVGGGRESARESACLVQIYGDDLGKRYPIDDEVTIGRGDENTIIARLPNVSRNHARVFQMGDACLVEDLGSTNGTHVNDVEVMSPRELVNGDLITTGGLVFKFIVGGNVEALYHEEIYRLTILDGLTGMHNRRFLLEFLEREVARSKRHERPLSMAMLDIDHFKSVNDTHGHLAGDTTLKRLAQIVEHRVRREELFARYGGEEFAIVLPETDLAGARAFSEMVRQQVEDAVITFDKREIRVTVSIGVAALEPDQEASDLIRAADDQLYRAKSSGRNRVCP